VLSLTLIGLREFDNNQSTILVWVDRSSSKHL
jgi:hypothetical protein